MVLNVLETGGFALAPQGMARSVEGGLIFTYKTTLALSWFFVIFDFAL